MPLASPLATGRAERKGCASARPFLRPFVALSPRRLRLLLGPPRRTLPSVRRGFWIGMSALHSSVRRRFQTSPPPESPGGSMVRLSTCCPYGMCVDHVPSVRRGRRPLSTPRVRRSLNSLESSRASLTPICSGWPSPAAHPERTCHEKRLCSFVGVFMLLLSVPEAVCCCKVLCSPWWCCGWWWALNNVATVAVVFQHFQE